MYEARKVWRNYPVRNEKDFLNHFREQAFADSRVATMVAAIGGTALMVQRTILSPSLDGVLINVAIATNSVDITSGMLLFWSAPFVFAVLADWSKRNYQWVLTVVFSLCYLRLVDNTIQEYATAEAATVPAIYLSVFAAAFLRLPFHFAFWLSLFGFVATFTSVAWRFGGLEATSFFIPVGIAVLLGLFGSWRSERRERRLFERQLESEDLISAAENAAIDIRAEQKRAEESATAALVAAKQKELVFEELRKAHAQRDFLIKSFYHDAKQPLVAIGIEARELKAMAATNQALTSLLPRAKTIVNAALDFERLLEGLRRLVELGTFEPTYEPVSVNSLLASTKDAYAERASKKGLRFIVTERDIDATQVSSWPGIALFSNPSTRASGTCGSATSFQHDASTATREAVRSHCRGP